MSAYFGSARVDLGASTLLPAVTAAVLGGAVEGGSARAEPRAGGASIHVTGPGLFAREFGAIDGTSDPALAPALGRLKRRRT